MIDHAMEEASEEASDGASEEASGEVTAAYPAERRTILVDGFNVLHAVLEESERETGWWRRTQRDRLLRLAAGWPIATDELWVAFDGAHPAWAQWAEPVVQLEPVGDQLVANGPHSLPGNTRAARRRFRSKTRPFPASRRVVHSVFVESADDWIVRQTRRALDPCRTIVVTRDRQVAGRCRSAGGTVWAPHEFLAKCGGVLGVAAPNR